MISPCRDRCEFRYECKVELDRRFREEGAENVKKLQEERLAANQEDESSTSKNRNLDPIVSPLVSEALTILSEAGYKAVYRKNYISLEKEGRVYFNITRYKSDRVERLVRLVHQRPRSDYPEELQAMISVEKMGRDHYLLLNNLSDLGWFCEKFPIE